MMIEQDDYLLFPCPHCLELVMVMKKDINCRIFRHAVYKDNYLQVNPHLPKKLCEYLMKDKEVYGCTKPFEIIFTENGYEVDECGYI